MGGKEGGLACESPCQVQLAVCKAYAHNFGSCPIVVALHHGWENVLQLGLIIVQGNHRGIDSGGNGRDDGRHAVQIVNATGVVYPQVTGQPGL